MLQRIQTVYLLLGATACAALPLVRPEGDPTAFHLASWVFAGLAATLAIITIFLYRTRRRQRKLVTLLQLLSLIALICLAIAFATSNVITLDSPPDWMAAYLLLPSGGMILFWLARRGIDSDIRLLKSVDRLR